MLRNGISLYLYFAVLVTTFFSAYIISKGRSSYMKIFSAMFFCISIYLFGYLLEINASDLDEMLFWNQIQYFGLPFFPALWLMLALLYTKKVRVFKGWSLVLLFLVPVLTFIFRLTSPWHTFFYSSWELQHTGAFNLLYLEKGPWYHVSSAYSFLSLVVSNMVFYEKYRESSKDERARFLILFCATLIPFMGLVLIIIDFKGLGIDYSALLTPASILLMMYFMFKYDFLEIKTLARETMFEQGIDGLILLDKEFRVMDYNKAAQTFFSYMGITLKNYPIEDIISDRQDLHQILKKEKTCTFRLIYEGEERFFEINTVVMRDSYDGKAGMLKSIRDITETKKLQEKLKVLATIDALSGLNNREQFMQLAQKEFARAKRYKLGFSLLMMDIDHFKKVNDTYGHAAGDAVIREIGKLIRKRFRGSDICGRLGGEEFAVLMTNTSFQDAGLASENFRKMIAKEAVVYENISIGYTVSIGVTSYYPEAKHIDEILKCADESLYEAKARGRNQTWGKLAYF